MQKLPTITIAANERTTNQAHRMLRKPVSLYMRACINRTLIASCTNKYGWNRLAGFVRCTFWQALKARLGITNIIPGLDTSHIQISLAQPACTGVALLWRYVNDKLELAIQYAYQGNTRIVPINHKVQFDKPFDLKLRMPAFDKGHGWGYYLPPALHQLAKNKFTCKLRCTIGHQAKDAYGGRL